MAYNSQNETQKEIAVVDKNTRGDKIRVARIEKVGKTQTTVSVDVRTMYTADDGEVRPTQRGIRIDSETAPDIILAMIKALGEDARQQIIADIEDIEME